MSFIDSFMNAAKYRDEKDAKENEKLMGGVKDLTGAVSDFYKFKQREKAANGLDELKAKRAELQSELDRLLSTQAGSTPNLDYMLAGYNTSINTGRF